MVQNLRMVWSVIFTMKHMKLVVDCYFRYHIYKMILCDALSCCAVFCRLTLSCAIVHALEPLTCMIGVQRSKPGCSKLITINHILGYLGEEKNIPLVPVCQKMTYDRSLVLQLFKQLDQKYMVQRPGCTYSVLQEKNKQALVEKHLPTNS